MKEVAVIGAGAAGLAAIRALIKYKDKVNITAYELSDRVGGLWVNRDPQRKTAMNDNLRANFPKEVGGFLDFPFSDDIQESFVSHKVVLEYMERYAQHFDMHQYIKLRHRVLEVDPFSSETGEERWYVTVRNEEIGAVTTKVFDAVFVCNGHETKKYIPDIEGMKTYTGDVMHSFYYQSPDYFSDKTVVIVGGGFSGTEILLDLLPAAKQIYASHHNETLTAPYPEKSESVPDISKIDGEDIILKDGRVIHADVIILATGYRFHFPFLSERCRPEVKDDHVTNIYMMMVDIEHPSLYYIGLNKYALTFRQFCLQSELAAAFITGKIPPVSNEDMQKEYAERYKSTVTDPGKIPKDFHAVLVTQWEYHDTLAKQSLSENTQGKLVEKITMHIATRFFKNFQHFQDCVYKIVSDEDFEVVYEPPELAD